VSASESRSVAWPGRGFTLRAYALHVLLGIVLALALGFALYSTGDLWFRSTNALTPDPISWAALALAGLGLAVVLLVVWARLPPVTTATAAILLGAAVAPLVLERDVWPSWVVDDLRLLPLGSWSTTYLTIGVLAALTFRNVRPFRR
jgi:hypothetical protein